MKTAEPEVPVRRLHVRRSALAIATLEASTPAFLVAFGEVLVEPAIHVHAFGFENSAPNEDGGISDVATGAKHVLIDSLRDFHDALRMEVLNRLVQSGSRLEVG